MIIAVFDSGVDYTHEVFGAAHYSPIDQVCGMPRDALVANVERAISGEITRGDLEWFADNAARAAQEPEMGKFLLPGIDFAGHAPDMDFSAQSISSMNIFDYNGHGTASAGIVVRHGHSVLPVKVGYSLAPQISLHALVRGCEWLINQKRRGLDCHLALWPFGIGGEGARDFYEALVSELAVDGIEVYASGRAVYENVARDDEVQLPSDINSVMAVDESLTLKDYVFKIESKMFRAWHLPGTPLPDRSVFELRMVDDPSWVYCGSDDSFRICPHKSIPRSRKHLEPARRGITLVVGAQWPYIVSSIPYTFSSPVFVTQSSAADLELTESRRADYVVRLYVEPGVNCTKEAPCSFGLRRLGPTGGVFPVAHSRNRWSGAFGSSIAACTGICEDIS